MVAVLIGGAIVLVLSMQGPSSNSKYLKALQTDGLSSQFAGDESALAAGHRYCDQLKSGATQPRGSAADQVAVDTFCPAFKTEFRVLEKTTVHGEFVLHDSSYDPLNEFSTPDITESDGGGCEGDGGYGDINSSTQVVVTDQSGKEVARTSLGEGSGSEPTCTFNFSFPLTEGSTQYVVAVGHRGQTNYTWSQIKQPGAIELSLGG